MSVQRWVAAYIKKGIDRVRIKKPGGSKSSITDENKEIIISPLFNVRQFFVSESY
jgi:transposase